MQVLVSEFNADSQDLQIDLECLSRITLAPEVNAQLLRIIQEALSNVRKHAGANDIWVECFDDSGDAVIKITDDGAGFDPEDVISTNRYGLRGMRERANLIGADFQIVSHKGRGTSVVVRVPVGDMSGEVKA